MDSPSRHPKTPVVLLHTDGGPHNGHDRILALAREIVGFPRFAPCVASLSPELLRAARETGIATLPLRGGPFGLHDKFRLRRFLKDARKAVLHSQDAASAALAHAVAGSCSCAVHVHTRRDAVPVPPGRKGSPIRDAGAVVALSASIGKFLASRGVESGKIRIIPSGIDPMGVVKRKKRDDERFIFAVMGDLTPENGHETLIRALPHLERHNDMPDWEIRIVGEGELFHPLLELAMTLGVKGRLAILGRQKAGNILPHCDALISPAVSPAVNGEDNGDALREGWAAELPVIASDLPSHCELARNRENALVYPADDPASLAAHMADVARDADLARRLCKNGAAALGACTAGKTAEAYIALYEELLFSGE